MKNQESRLQLAVRDYKGSLTSGDTFTVHTRMEQVSRVKFAFHQRIVRESDGKEMIAALITGTGVNAQGRPFCR